MLEPLRNRRILRPGSRTGYLPVPPPPSFQAAWVPGVAAAGEGCRNAAKTKPSPLEARRTVPESLGVGRAGFPVFSACDLRSQTRDQRSQTEDRPRSENIDGLEKPWHQGRQL